ncbi:ABC transporter ATP-binding protein [Mycobacterium yunnanensis]|uniref:ABC transporter ATP-binding protein n=1 Tax=Mycobacterium yunnanensis TaxID=368477 RepID=A0A9X3C390_9MYCO|nr:ABC transporter ATP-binding protein [Mycobacterium yunnanensis]MCV7423998.1 ABC transporter ATP-binding protein [Mycobacterium yunnanensis]
MSAPDTTPPLLTVRGLAVRFGSGAKHVEAVRSVDLDVYPGKILGLVGESGSGKSVTARSLIGLAGSGATVSADTMRLGDVDLTGLSTRQWRPLRGAKIGFVLQDALGSLDPVRKIEDEVGDSLRVRPGSTRTERRAKILDVLARVHLPDAESRIGQRAYQLSGGQRQRVLIAGALVGEPSILIADEPTTALDPRTQRHILDLFAEVAATGVGVLLVSHDLGAISRIADDVAVIHDGRVVETGSTTAVLSDPRHPYTRSLLSAIPGRQPVQHPPPRPQAEPALSLLGVDVSYPSTGRRRVDVLRAVNLEVPAGASIGLVGQSGSGKSTLARVAIGAADPDAGTVRIFGTERRTADERTRRALRRRVQLVHQDPLSAFDPRLSVGGLLRDALRAAGTTDRRVVRTQIRELLDLVRLPDHLATRSPLRLSGGQRQRVAIARALAVGPSVVVWDEPVSALDVSTQQHVIELIRELRVERDLTYLFITHDLGVLREVADHTAVLADGEIVEFASTEALLAEPTTEYGRDLVESLPSLPQLQRTPPR